MAGLLDGVLPYIYSQSDRLKRHVGGLLSDPVGSLAQTGGLLQDQRREMNALDAQAFADPLRPFGVTNQAALGKLIDKTMNGPMGFAPAGITAWHGTPHVFDKFDSSKIGSGEGAQAYGHGLYLADTPAVAQQYADKVKDMGAIKRVNEELSQMAKVMAADEIPGSYRKYKTDAGRQASQRYDALMDQRSGVSNAPGNLYKVDLPDDKIAKMLDWDKPLSQQAPEVQKAINNLGIKTTVANDTRFGGPPEREIWGKELYWALNNQKGTKVTNPETSQALRAAGIPGIRYLDGNSRGNGLGSSNYVVFPGEENILSILERNGKPVR